MFRQLHIMSLNRYVKTLNLISAIQKADKTCGNCGCDLDSLYKRALELL